VEELLLSVTHVRGDNDVMQTEIQTAEPLVPQPCCRRLKLLLTELTELIPSELIQAGVKTLRFEILA
jgi:hypothetical protein